MKYYLGFDIGGTKCAVSVGEVSGNAVRILKRHEIPTQTSPTDTLEQLAPFVQDYQAAYPIVSAGVSCGGPLDNKTGEIMTPPNLKGWHHFNICHYIKNRFGLHAKLENDANACALAEWRFGAGRGTQNMIFLTFGTGMGAGLILDGKLYSGTNGNAGEVGHMRLSKTGPLGYGKHGSFEGFCSGGGIARLAKDTAQKCKNPPAYTQGEVTTKQLAEYAKSGDAFAKKIFAKSGEKLGGALALLVDLFNPEKIVIGGVYMRSAELLIKPMQRKLKQEALGESLSVCEIVRAQLSENVGDYAAIAIAMEA